ncbi:type VI secretion system contractile sheath domain-containing protein [Maridesulfovibrio zosterae]|uniref:type VI secretion system contractile sheath domain-containing protein n=1 Tax=Maridesulfovibrio zosterae TaxID=82171 RepID=UPI00041AD65A|nr:type VI secretion system contractile sheath large subunit [Maridesulfovibrio zosterae]
MNITQLPFCVLALAPFSPSLETDTPPVIRADTLSLNDAVAQLSPNIDIPIDKSICPDANIAISIKSMADFKPKNISKKTAFLKELTKAADYIKKGGAATDLNSKFPRIAQLIDIPAASPSGAAAAKTSAIEDILSMVDSGTDSGTGSRSGNQSVISQIDSLHAKILQTIFSNPVFRSMESAWRGAQLLAMQAPSGTIPTVNLILVPLSDANCLPVFDQLETLLADTPPDLIVIDRSLSNSPRSMVELERIMTFAESMMAPAAVALGPQFFEISDWQELKSVRFIPGLLEGAEYGRWKTLVEMSGAGWTVPCVDSVMARPLYQPESGFSPRSFSETDPLWINAPWAIAALCVRSIAMHRRPTRFADRGSVRLEERPMTAGSEPSPLEMLPGTDRLADFKQAGIIALAGTKGRDQVFVTADITMDGGPLRFRLFLSQLINFLIHLSTVKRDEIENLESDLRTAISLFIQNMGLPEPDDLKVSAKEDTGTFIPLEISFSAASEILSGQSSFSFGFNW